MTSLIFTLALGMQTYGNPEVFCHIKDKAIDESSGIAASNGTGGVFYTHNDSGDVARFFRFDKKGEITGIFRLNGVQALDWEDMASAKVDGKPYLYLGDIGDNARVRKEIFIHRVAEPEPDQDSTVLTKFDTYVVKYPDKARDCEALMVHPKTGDIYLVTKARDNETVVYRLPAPKASGNFTLEKLGTIDINTGGIGPQNWVTASDISPNGKYVVVRTYSGAVEYTVPKNDFVNWWKTPQRQVKLRAEKQGEAICYTGDGMSFLTTSEGNPCEVSRIPRKN
ncbi:MAG: hypothetical protein KDC26_00795 [Armatimonadetes bacterium]|nr:hypothetical protein [Armatimonadota bacterium]